MTNLINEQVNLVLEDLELMTNPYERCMVRTHLIGALANMTLVSSDELNSLPKGKDAIKSDIVKENNAEETVEEDVVIETHTHLENEPPIQFEEEEVQEEQSQPQEVDVDPNTVEETQEANGPIIVQVGNEDR